MQDDENNNQAGKNNKKHVGDSTPSFAPPPPPTQQGEDKTPTPPPTQQGEDNTPANFQLGALLPKKLNVPIQPHSLSFDENKFIRLLAGSISLSREEKKRIIDSLPKLKQSQIDELMRIFEEEKEKFAQPSPKHLPQLEKLAQQHYQDWIDIDNSYISEKKKEKDQEEADEIRKTLGINPNQK